MPTITYEQARQISLKIWSHAKKYGDKPDKSQLLLITEKVCGKQIILKADCGFCEYFEYCDICPLQWENSHDENYSNFKSISRSCSRNFWHWSFWRENKLLTDSKKHMKYWADKMYKEILATPVHQSQKRRNDKNDRT